MSSEEINKKYPDCLSDYYMLVDSQGHVHRKYCHMETSCNSTGGWMRLAYLNMTDNNEKCPDECRLYSENGVQVCGRPVSSGGSGV